MTDDRHRIDTSRDGSAPVRGLDRLPRRRAPARDLWPGIESRLAPRRSRYALAQFALAASLIAGLAAVVGLGTRHAGVAPEPAGRVATLLLTDDSRAIVEANVALVRGAEREVQRALRQNPDSPALRSLLASAENRQRALRAML